MILFGRCGNKGAQGTQNGNNIRIASLQHGVPWELSLGEFFLPFTSDLQLSPHHHPSLFYGGAMLTRGMREVVFKNPHFLLEILKKVRLYFL